MKNFFSRYFILLLTVSALAYYSCTPKTADTVAQTAPAKPVETTKEMSTPPSTPPPPPPAPSASEIGATTAIPVDPSVRMGTLENGLKYYIQKNSKPENRAELRLAVHAGSMQEDDDQLGLAHFVEHMAFNGSENFEKNELVDYLESVGTKFGPDLNAYTSFDETVYMLQARTDDTEQLKKGLLVLEDWAGGVAFDDEEIDKERGVVESEWRSRLSPDQRIQQKTFPIIYQGSRYATRLPIGKPEIINGASYETVKRFYRDWYRPDLMALSLVGDFDVDMMEKEVISRFSKLKNPDGARERKDYSVPGHKETLISIASDKEASFTRLQLMYKHPHIEVKTVKDFRGQLVRSLYNQMLNARLDELSQSADPPFSFSYSGYGPELGDKDSYYSYAFVSEGGAE
ncbi:MAG: pitrilysin family protein, partial [Bacteroidota bacterium]